MEDTTALITRLKKELQQARSTRDRIETVGLSASFGGSSFAQVNYDTLLRRIGSLERQLFNAEATRDGLNVNADLRVSRVSQY